MTVGTKWYVRRCAIGTLSALAVYLLALALCAYLTVSGVVGEGQMARCVWLCALLASFAGVAFGGSKTVRRGTMAICCGAAFYVATVLLGFMVGGAFAPAGALALIVPVVLGASGAAMLLGKKGGGKKRGRHSRRGRR